MLNNLSIQGRLTHDLELRRTPSGVSVVSFSIATERNYSDDSGQRPVDFIDCTAWRGTAEFLAKYFAKGDLVLLDGEIQTRAYTDKKGDRRKATEVVVGNAYFCGAKKATNRETFARTTLQDAEAAKAAQKLQEVTTDGFEVLLDDGQQVELPFE